MEETGEEDKVRIQSDKLERSLRDWVQGRRWLLVSNQRTGSLRGELILGVLMGDSECCSSRQSESSPPFQSRKKRQKFEVFRQVLCRLRELDVEEASEPCFEDELWTHFTMLPVRYALDVNTFRAEDVLMHKRLLNLARDSLMTAVDVRLVQVRPTIVNQSSSGNCISSYSLSPSTGIRPFFKYRTRIRRACL
ncbi:hypothetical protein M569_01812 [Genlisea aurea]|uniref:Uncharacterized protein n=1 Tax=Genlisea aurea TaxID=192259 RepID=S8EAP7_9LAMI|nr:hypothetical protein M569_01812 [Genlisea aurea]